MTWPRVGERKREGKGGRKRAKEGEREKMKGSREEGEGGRGGVRMEGGERFRKITVAKALHDQLLFRCVLASL